MFSLLVNGKVHARSSTLIHESLINWEALMRGTKSGFDVRSKGTSGAINSRKNLCLHDNHYSLSPPRYLVHYFTRRSRENGFGSQKLRRWVTTRERGARMWRFRQASPWNERWWWWMINGKCRARHNSSSQLIHTCAVTSERRAAVGCVTASYACKANFSASHRATN